MSKLAARRLSLNLILIAFLAVTVSATWSRPCQAQAPASNIFFILDASGSMWGQIKDQAKIDIAKEVLTGLIKDLPADVRVGLVAYGHRKKGDCNDVEELVPLGPQNKNALITKIQAISPKGMTPITLSVKQTAEKLKTLEQDTTIILVSDGKETCAGDPCALVRELRKSGAKFIMHVVGFDVTKEERKQLECMAKAGGGTYYAAQDAGQLRMALDQVMKEALAENLIIRSVSPAGWPVIAQVLVFKANTKEQVGARVDKRAAFRLPAGIYDVSARLKMDDRQVKNLSGLEVKKYEELEEKVVFSVARLGGWVKDATGKPTKGWIEIFRIEDGEEKRTDYGSTEKEPRVFDVVPGLYKMVLKDTKADQQTVIKNIQVDAGKEVIKEASFALARLGGWVKDPTGKPTKGWIEIFKIEDGEEKRLNYASTGNEPRIFDVPPGLYRIMLKDTKTNQQTVIKNIQVDAGQEVIKVASFALARLGGWVKDTKGKPTKGWIEIFKIEDGEEKRLKYASTGNEPRIFDVPPGLYKVMLKDTKANQQTIIKNIQVDAGQEIIKEASFALARLGGWVKDAAGKPIKGWIEIFKIEDGEEKRLKYASTGKEPRIFDVPPGLYKVMLKETATNKEKVLTNIQVKDGQEIIKEVQF
jgi:Ca-activated chloride channel family protein